MHNFAVAVYHDDFEALLIRQTSTWYYIVYGHIHRILIRWTIVMFTGHCNAESGASVDLDS